MQLKPEVFEKAAELLEKGEWWDGSLQTKDSKAVYCISTAVSSAAKHTGNRSCYHERLIQYFGLSDLYQVYKLNDSMPESSGKTWAIGHLRTLARKVRRENIGEKCLNLFRRNRRK